MSSFSVVEIHRSELKFSAGHFTIFSETEREALHGHNYSVGLAIKVEKNRFGISFDYRHYKKKLAELCAKLDGKLLLPQNSPYLKIEMIDSQCIAEFNKHSFSFPKQDVILLPISNTTLEEMSEYLLKQLHEASPETHVHGIHEMILRVFNGAQSGSALLHLGT